MRFFKELAFSTIIGVVIGGCTSPGIPPQGGATAPAPAGPGRKAEVVSPRDFVVPQPAERGGMHACMRGAITPLAPNTVVGGIVTGIHADRNELLCTFPFRIGTEIPASLATPSRQTVQCPPNHYVTGIRADRLEALCAPILDANLVSVVLGRPIFDPPHLNTPATQRRGMQACPYGSGLVGFTVGGAGWTLHCAQFPICWYFNTHAMATPCPSQCALPPGTGSRQGVCS